MKYCKDCKFHKRERVLKTTDWAEHTYDEDRCFVFDGQEHPVVGGKMEWIECSNMRMGPCGMEGKLFEEIVA